MVLTRFSCLMSYSNEHLKFLKSDFKNLRDESDQSGVTSRQGKIGNISFFSLIYSIYVLMGQSHEKNLFDTC